MPEQSLKENRQNGVCRRRFRVLLVGGFKVSEIELQKAAWVLCKWIYNLSERQSHTGNNIVRSVTSSASTLTDIPRTNVRQIQEFIFGSGTCSDGITCVIFAHSQGAKLLHVALQTSTIHEFLVEKSGYSDEDANELVAKIRQSLAVFTIGGIDALPTDLAKVVVNLRFVEDTKSFIGEKIFGNGNGNTAVLVFSKQRTPVSSQQMYNGIIMKEESPSWWNIRSWFSPVIAFSAGRVRHGLYEYMSDKPVMKYVIERLSLDKELTCGCM